MMLLQLPDLTLANWIILAPALLRALLMALVGIAGLAGAVMVGLTRPDAFDAGDRMPKAAWAAILIASGIACLSSVMFLGIIGCVCIGVYFFDVRPQLNNILRGDYGW
ncbi:DUF2516 family protein [Corynebacterium sp. Marseille-P3884]|uniref:DUF2516 family protein n=1 Tax=Corynebacterium sp. Marseille-P3884 TaxID=2495409 RepID=UPI001B3200BE|nr:DUF2516 family protein [Corynebacterium sp. Marseille-P3884]MBP3947923.1 DUF2516 family protein [Corynebacterium sp. Marseille-P3884]